MGRFGSAGRGGRLGMSGPKRKPNYLSLSPPTNLSKAPDLQTNKFFALRHQFPDDNNTDFIEIIDETDPNPTSTSTPRYNGRKNY